MIDSSSRDYMVTELKKRECRVIFKKVNGEERDMVCTLQEEMLPQQVDIEEAIQKKEPNPNVVAAWDIKAKGWRSFRVDSVLSFT